MLLFMQFEIFWDGVAGGGGGGGSSKKGRIGLSGLSAVSC
jgi:hypothetical protein